MNWSEVKSWKTKTYAPVTVLVCRLWPKISFTGQKLLCISKYFTPTTFSDSPKLFWCVTALSEIVINKCYRQGKLYANLELIFTCICLLFFLLVPSPPPSSSWRWGTRMPTVSGLLIFPWRRKSTVGLRWSSAPRSSAESTGRGSTGGPWRTFVTWRSSTRYNYHDKRQK